MWKFNPTERDNYRWVVLVAGTFAQAATAAYYLGLPAIAPTLRSEFGLSLPGLGLLLGAPTAGLVTTLIAWGRLSDQLGERAVMTVGLLTTGAVLAMAPATRGPATLGLLLFGAGAAAACVNAASGRAVLAWFTPSQRGLAMGIRHTAVPCGAALAAVLLPRIVHAHGVPAAFFALAAANLAAGLAVWAWIHDPGSAGEPPGAAPPVLRDPRLLRLAAASALLVAPQFVVTAFTVELLRAEASLSVAAAATVLAAAQLVGAAGRLIVGWWSDRLHSRLRPLRVLAYSVAAGFGALALATYGPPALLVAAVVVVAGPATCWNGLAFTAAAELAPPGRAGTALGAQNTVNFTSASLTPAIAGAVVAAAGWPVALGLFALPALVSALLIRVDARCAGGHCRAPAIRLARLR